MTLENASVTSESLKAMQHGQKSMKKLNKQMFVFIDICVVVVNAIHFPVVFRKIEKVEATLDNIRDQIEDHEEGLMILFEQRNIRIEK
jgi:hypothetical protein